MLAEIATAYPATTGITICALMVIAFIAAIAAWHPHHHDAKHRPSRAAR
jgi:hypothetical protein